MPNKIRKRTDDKLISRFYRKDRIRKKIKGTAQKPRMSVFKSSKHFTVQFIDDANGHTLAHCTTMVKDLRTKLKANIEGAKEFGKLVAETAQKSNIKTVVFDRNGFRYHGAIKALAETARSNGLEF
jgi:large subunit ribosomal protein L18